MGLYYDDGRVQLWHGQALDSARELADQSVSCIVTSPPYFGLRDYGADGQIGAEPTVEEYVDALVTLFRELRRVLADDGTLWLNLGDSYSSGGRDVYDDSSTKNRVGRSRPVSSLPGKNLLMVPARVALVLQADGWILRSEIVWAKPNPMPESVTDRPTKSHEMIYLFSKSERYHYDANAISEESVTNRPLTSWADRRDTEPSRRGDPSLSGHVTRTATLASREGRNARDVWTISTVPFPGAHFAVFPPELPRRCIRAGAKKGGVVLDPFSGSGTTGKVALMEGCSYIGFDLNSDYLDLSLRERFAQQPLDLGEAD